MRSLGSSIWWSAVSLLQRLSYSQDKTLSVRKRCGLLDLTHHFGPFLTLYMSPGMNTWCVFPLLRPWGGPCGSTIPWEEAGSLTWVAKAGSTISSFRVAQPWPQRSPGPGLTVHALQWRLFVGDVHIPTAFTGWHLRRSRVGVYDL